MSHPESPLRTSQATCRLVVVQDQLQPCPYLDSTVARMPLRLPLGVVTPAITDELLANGFRRSGDLVYRTQCPECTECKPTRIEVDKFKLTSSMRRVINRGSRELTCHWNPPSVDDGRVALFNKHRHLRELGADTELISKDSYRSFLVDSCCDTRELAICLDDKLIAVAIVDAGQSSVSAVYTYFDPDASRFSLGTFAILKQIEWAKQTERRYVYLGMYVSANAHLNYKARFAPQQRYQDDVWVDQS
ncbi:arginyltransferase [Rubripirellula reticaptiva]|uniref:arginyltransferase n=1 Tax=Rubripirellula reticaptiva TaxID=2528013 RepID=UPI001FEB11C8|nr:arginyltransferase [Rubripirellula reticaptiva]